MAGTEEKWENFLDPEVMKTRLTVASLYIAGFELLKTAIVERLKDFYSVGADYSGEVLSRNRSPVYASLNWLQESQAITDGDIDQFERVKTLRNELAHAMTKMLSDGFPSDVPERFHEMSDLLLKIERWWIINVDMAVEPDSAEGIDQTSILPGSVIGLQLMIEVALGPEAESRKYLDEFRKQKSSGGTLQ